MEMKRKIQVNRATSRTELKELLNQIVDDDSDPTVLVDRMRDSPNGVSYLVIWETRQIAGPNP